MTPEEWSRIKAIAGDALELPAPARTEFIAAACGEDRPLRTEVEQLLRSIESASGLYETPVLSAPGMADALITFTTAGVSLVGTSVGVYRIVRQLGQGGMGRVYLAERVDGEFDQRVAIKFVSGLPTQDLLQRFRDERRILATLDHPNIAHLIDGGTTADGLPYVMMEYVEGVPIDAFADARGLDINARVGLFLEVCAAVQYAHQRLVIHRDLKAGNILVTSDGAPKLLDFGIAKLLDPATTTAEPTRTMYRLITPETASPEQVRGEPVTTATDVYALGLLLYRLLTGRSPFQLTSYDHSTLMQVICEQDPLAPSQLSPPHDGVSRRAHESIDADLDLIVLKALRKEPERRYATASQLSDDLQRYLDGRPVHAAPDARAYRIRKYIGRHRLGMAAAAAVSLAVVGGTLATARQSQIANRERARAQGRFDDVRQLANVVLFEVHDALESLPGSTPVRRLLIARLLEYLEKLSRDAGAESRLQLEVATAYQKVGSVQGNPYHANIGDSAGAMQSYKKALAITQALVDRESTASHRKALGESHLLLGDMFWAEGSFVVALEHYRLAVTLRDRLVADDPSENMRLDLALSHYGVGQSLLRMGDYAGAADAYMRAQALQSQVMKDAPSNALARRSFATSAAKLGDVLAVQGDHRRALDYHSQAAATFRDSFAANPVNPLNKRTLALLLYRMAIDQKETDQSREALVTGRAALDLETSILASDPANEQSRTDAAAIHRVLGQAYADLDQPGEALNELAQAEKTHRTALAANPNAADTLGDLALTLLTRGDVLAEGGDVLQALKAFAESVRLLDTVASRAESRRYLAITHEHAGDAERQLARAVSVAAAGLEHQRAACRHYQQGLDALQSQPARSDPREAESIRDLSGKLADCSRP